MPITFTAQIMDQNIFEASTPLRENNLEELLAELRLNDIARSFSSREVIEACDKYITQKGWFDTEDWLDQAIRIVANIASSAEALGAHTITAICVEH